MSKKESKVKHGVMEAKCKLSREECSDPSCPVHGEPVEEPEIEDEGEDGKSEAPAPELAAGNAASAPKLSALTEEVRQALADARQIVHHLSHPNDFTRGLVERIDKLLS